MTGDLYTLPDLPYDPGALEPHMSGQIMELHHDKHHAAYVKGANTALEKLANARDSDNFDAALHQIVYMLETDLERVRLHTRLLRQMQDSFARTVVGAFRLALTQYNLAVGALAVMFR